MILSRRLAVAVMALLCTLFAGCQGTNTTPETVENSESGISAELAHQLYQKSLNTLQDGLAPINAFSKACLDSDIGDYVRKDINDAVNAWQTNNHSLMLEAHAYLTDTFLAGTGHIIQQNNYNALQQRITGLSPADRDLQCLRAATLIRQFDPQFATRMDPAFKFLRSRFNPVPTKHPAPDSALAGTWEGARDSNIDCPYLRWHINRNADGSYHIQLFSDKDADLPSQQERGRWWTYGNHYFEHSELTFSPDVYSYTTDQDHIDFKAVSLSSAGDCPVEDYQFRDVRIKEKK